MALYSSPALAQNSSSSTNSTVSTAHAQATSTTNTSGSGSSNSSGSDGGQTVDPSKWYALYTNDKQFMFLTSNNGVLTSQYAGSVQDVSKAVNKGQRFRFLNGIGNNVICQDATSGNNKIGSENGKWITNSTNQGNWLSAQWEEENKTIQLSAGSDYVSSCGTIGKAPYGWLFAEVDASA